MQTFFKAFGQIGYKHKRGLRIWQPPSEYLLTLFFLKKPAALCLLRGYGRSPNIAPVVGLIPIQRLLELVGGGVTGAVAWPLVCLNP